MIELRHLGKDYREAGRLRTVLQDVSAVIADGEFVAIRGRSGSGKTTLLNLIAGIDTPSRGEVIVDGTALSDLSSSRRTAFRRDHVGFVFQFFNLIPTLTVLENVLLPAELAGRGGHRARAAAFSLLEQVGLADRAAVFPDRLSGGEQQRVALARALSQQPELVLADEPTGNLDETTGEAVLRLLEDMTRSRGKTLILVTHSHRLAARADRVLAIEHGQLVPAAQVTSPPPPSGLD
ncbi:MAG: ABC transporter ATP-binding protein [Chloroflexota bacterium]